jgi:hypothetical protein
MALYIKDKVISGVFFRDKAITAIYYGKRLLWLLGNFFTKDKDVFLTKDKEIFEVKEE